MKAIFPFLLVLLALSTVTAHAKPPVFYVAPGGSDAASGTTAKTALRTVPAALAAARRSRHSNTKEAVKINLLPGVHTLAEPLRLDERDSDTSFHGAGKAILSGGDRITGWKNIGGNRWQAVVPGVAAGKRYFSQLFVNGERRYRPRLPKTGYYFIEAALPGVDKPVAGGAPKGYDAFRFKAGDIRADWHDLARVEVLPFHTWEMSRFPIQSVDSATDTVQFLGRTIGDQEFTNLGKGNRYLVENVREALSEPGEWYLDARTGVLTYLAKPGEDLNKVTVIAPRLESLLEIVGAKNITFERIQFAHTSYNAPKEGRSTWQAEADIPAAITIMRGENFVLNQSAVQHAGGYGIWLRTGTKKCHIFGSNFADLGAGGIKIGETGAPKNEDEAVSSNLINTCRIIGGGRLHPAGIGIWIGQAHDNRIFACEISDFYYSGVSIGWHWGYGTNAARNNRVEKSHIHHIGQRVLSDMGGIYTLGGSDKSELSGNLIHDIRSFSYGGWGIYFDEGTTGVKADHNVVYGTSASPFHQHYGKDNLVTNNVLAFGDEAQLIRTRDESHLSFTATQNIILYAAPTLLGGNWNDGANKFALSHNIYWRMNGEPVIFPNGRTLEEWQKTGQDVGSRVVDPGFRDPAKGDFRLRPGYSGSKIPFAIGQPAEGRGWLRPLPGVQKDVMTSFPLPRITPAFFAYVPPKLTKIDEGFEGQTPGPTPQSPTLQVITEPTVPAAGVWVTDETAATGKRSIRVTDAPGQKAPYNPHLFWQPRFDRGTVAARVALRWQRGATLSHEWRSYANGAYRTGPNMTVSPEGALTASGKMIATLPENQWVTLTITCGVGDRAKGTYDLTLSHRDAGGMIIRRELPNRDGKSFDRLDWWGFVAEGHGSGSFYMDDISLQATK